MADSAQAEPQASAGNPEIDTALKSLPESQTEGQNGDAASAPDIKQEPAGATDPALADFPDLSFALESFVSKRPLEEHNDTTNSNDHNNTEKPNNDEQASKRVKTEQQHEDVEPSFDEDGMELLVANALNDANLMNGFGDTSGNQHHESDAMDLDVPNAAPAIELPRPAPSFDNEPQNCLRIRSLYSLGNLAISTLLILSRNPIDDALITSRFKDTDQGKNFDDLRSAFDAIKRLYGSTDIISLSDPPLDDAEAQSIVSLSNLAQLGFWLSEASEASLHKASDNLFAIASEKDISSKVADLCLSIRTQLAVESLAEAGEGPFDILMNKVFSDDLENNLQSRRGEHDEMPEAEQHLLTSVELRREAFLHELQTAEGRASLGTQYPTSHLSRNFATYTRDRLSSATELATKLGLTIPPNEPTPVFDGLVDDNIVADIDMDDISSLFERTAAGLVESALAGVNGDEHHDHANMNGDLSATNGANGQADGNSAATRADGPKGEYEELQALVAQSTSDYVETTLKSLSPANYQLPHSSLDTMATQSSYLTQYPNQQNYNTYQQPPPDQSMQQAAPDGMLPPHQTDSTAALYDKARQAALSKSSAHTRREGLNSTRRPWTQAEEKALMAGLDMVKGPHWSQILTLFGQNGTISNILSERTQVQLKDKARNLKLFFLKTNSEMPFYLQAVTGELKTRAPTQAARKEAEERARMNSEEDQAKVQGIMALSHLQYPQQNMQHPQTPNQQHMQHQHQQHQSPHKGVNSPALQPSHAQSNAPVGQQQTHTQYQTTASQPPLAPAAPQNNYQAPQGQQQGTPRSAGQAPQTQSPYNQSANAPQTTQGHQPQHIQPRQPAPAPQQQQQQQQPQQAQRPQQSQPTGQTGQTQASPSQHRPMHLPQVPMQRPVQPATTTQSPAQPTTGSVTATATTTTPPVRTSSIQFKTSFPHTTSQSQLAAQASAAAGKTPITAAASIQPRPYPQATTSQTGSTYSATAQTAASRTQQSPPLAQATQRPGSQTPQSAQSFPRPQQTNGTTQGSASPAQHPRPVLPQTQQALNASRPQGQNQQAHYASSPAQQRTNLPQNTQGTQQGQVQTGQSTATNQGNAQSQQQYNAGQPRPQTQQQTPAQGQAQAQQTQPRPQYQSQQPQGQQTQQSQQAANMTRTGSGNQPMAIPGQQQSQPQAQQQAARPQSQGPQQQQQQQQQQPQGQAHQSPHTSQQHTPVPSQPPSTTQSPAPPSRPQSNPQFANQTTTSASPAPSQPPAQAQSPAQAAQQTTPAPPAAEPAKTEAPPAVDPLAALGMDDNVVDADLLRDLQAAIASAAAST